MLNSKTKSFRSALLSKPVLMSEEPLQPYKGASLIRCGNSDNGRWHVLSFENVLRKRLVARSEMKNMHERRSVLEKWSVLKLSLFKCHSQHSSGACPKLAWSLFASKRT